MYRNLATFKGLHFFNQIVYLEGMYHFGTTWAHIIFKNHVFQPYLFFNYYWSMCVFSLFIHLGWFV